MSRMITFAELKERVQSHQNACTDDTAKTTGMVYGSGLLGFVNGVEDQSNLFGEELAPWGHGHITDHAWVQLAERIGAPSVRWLRNEDKCPEELRKLLVNWKFDNNPEVEYLIRQKTRPAAEGEGFENTVRAVLSNQYSIYDHHQFIDALEDGIATIGRPVKVFRPQVDDEMRAYVLIDGVQFDATAERDRNDPGNDGGGLHPAVYISNSERGGGRVRITGGLYRSYCANGMIFGWEEKAGMEQTHRFKSAAHMGLLVHEGIASALQMSEAGAVAFMEKRAVLMNRTSLANVVDHWGTKYGIINDDKESWLAACTATYGHKEQLSMFAAINLATGMAHATEDHEKKEALERMGGAMAMAKVPYEWQDGRGAVQYIEGREE